MFECKVDISEKKKEVRIDQTNKKSGLYYLEIETRDRHYYEKIFTTLNFLFFAIKRS